ncbi:2-dehydropantoate 2-reductase [Daldinia caldariorum]|uniref:2-dehydropantoate 2-reductase n=1 Tax=Daldinia caldariorum TaxID=326644 RepID=UPI00200849CF|nr:2-dehydropantoate 2-reductase [Daldinia caldariorum]KAI1469194.1 2-dehydropantoate 2-reductase [Daldinia caldariorum]
MPKVLIFGTGSLGTCYAWALSNAVGQDNITAICRSNYEVASRNGFTIHSNLWGDNLTFQPRIARSVAEAVQQLSLDQQQFFDFVVVAAKAVPADPSVAEVIGPAVAKGKTAVVLLQNGIGIEDEYARLYPDNPLLSTVAYFPATQVSPAVVHHKEVEMLHVGTYPADAPAPHKDAAREFAELLGKGGATAKLHDDVQRKRWGKLLVNASWNPICALTRLRDREFVAASLGLGLGAGEDERGDDGVRFIKDVMMEIASVAQAYGYRDVNEEMVDFQIGRAVVRDLPGVQPSMLGDAFDKKSMEVDAIVGNVVRLARKKGLDVPMLRTIYLLANGLSESFTRKKIQA